MSELRCWHFHFSFSFVGDFDTILIKLKVNQNETTATAVEREEHQIVDEKIRSLPLLCSFSCHQSIKIRHAGETDFTKNYCLLYGKSGNLRGNAIINAHTHCVECVSIRFEMQPNRPSLLHCM